MTDYHMQMQ